MGNADSHSSSASTSSNSRRLSSRKEAVPSARGWWRSSREASRGRGRSQQPATSWSYEQHGSGSPQRYKKVESSGRSPKVLLSNDGSMRVQFCSRGAEPQGFTGPGPTADHSLRTSKGSSLSSEGSWYDSPWGNGEEPDSVLSASAEVSSGYATFSSTHTQDGATAAAIDLSPGFTPSLLLPTDAAASTCYSGRTDDSGVGDSLLLQAEPPDLRSASSTLLDNVIAEEAGSGSSVETRYFSHTLPCRGAQPQSPAHNNNRKDFLKSRISRLSDWTGSLGRKRRRTQEPHGCEVGGASLWSSNPLHILNQKPSSDAQRQEVYQNFMQELEMSCSRTELSEEGEGEEEEEEEEGEEELDLVLEEQLDLVLEEEPGLVRRAGWLSFKALITISRDKKLELVTRRRWRRYWVTLRGCSLLFYETYGRSGSEQEGSPRYALTAADAIVQPVPEHPRREHVFCLSNGHGDVCLFQATSQTDLENWVTAIHSASAAQLAQRRRGPDDTLRLLRCQSRSLLRRIDMDAKMKKMAELQLSVIKEQRSRKAVESQIQQWEQNLEKLNLDLFRLRCYQSSLQGGELPNPKSLLAVVSRPSKSLLGRLGVFSVSSFHALVCSRDEVSLRQRRLTGRTLRRRGLRSLEGTSRHCRDQKLERVVAPSAGHAEEVQQLSGLGVFALRVCQRDPKDFGLAVTGHVDVTGRSRIYISELDPLGPAKEGLRAGDEVLAVNGSAVSGLDLDLMQSVFSHRELQLLLRRDETSTLASTHQPSVTPPPPLPLHPSSLPIWTEGPSSPAGLTPPPQLQDVWSLDAEQNLDREFSLYQTFPEEPAAGPDPSGVPRNPYGREHSLQPPSPAHLSVSQRLRKVIEELVDTEKSYVKDLVRLFDLYLTPLQSERFLSREEMEVLFGSLPEMLDFQRVFLQTLEERITSCPNLHELETPDQFKKLLLSLGGSFLCYADHFKLYSGFCANHIKAQKVLERAKTDRAFKHFLEDRNPSKQHSCSLESYLIKPVQRVLKYPLLLRELVSLTEPGSSEHTHLTEALRAMEKVASHINEMQKIYEDFGSVFEQLAAEQSHTQVTEISMAEFLLRSSVVWLNPLPCLGRLRKEPELNLFVFKRAVILVQSDNKLKKKSGSRSSDPDPFRFRWLIPVSAVQVRSGGILGSQRSCVWELVHCRSEVEGRPETVFQLCSSGLETMVGVLRVLRSLKDRVSSGSLRRTRGASVSQGGGSLRRGASASQGGGSLRRGASAASQGGGSLRRRRSGWDWQWAGHETCSEPLLPPRRAAGGTKAQLCSLTSELEAQLQRLKFGEEEAEPAGPCERRRSSGSSELLELGGVLERDFSVQSMASIINEDCFYEAARLARLEC